MVEVGHQEQGEGEGVVEGHRRDHQEGEGVGEEEGEEVHLQDQGGQRNQVQMAEGEEGDQGVLLLQELSPLTSVPPLADKKHTRHTIMLHNIDIICTQYLPLQWPVLSPCSS